MEKMLIQQDEDSTNKMKAGGLLQMQPSKVELHNNSKLVELRKAENAWVPPSISIARRNGQVKAEDNKEENQLIIDEVAKKARGILNKLTPENFDKMVRNFMQLRLEDKDDRIRAVVNVVVENALDDWPRFIYSTAYARLVQNVCAQSQETARKFRKQILDKCQREFQNGSTDEDEIKKLEDDLAAADEDKKEAIKFEIENKRFMSRRRALGNVRFIGELYKLQMVTPKIIVECVNLLLCKSDQGEESYECLCKLLMTAGHTLEDHLKAAELRAADSLKRGIVPKFQPEEKYMEKTFAKLKALSGNNKLSSRIRFALLDVYELRDSNWKPRRYAPCPKTIAEVRRDAIRSNKEQLNMPPKKGDRNIVQTNKSTRFQVRKSGGTEQSTPTSGPHRVVAV